MTSAVPSLPGGRSDADQNRYVGFKTIATPRNTSAEDGVSELLSELEGMTYDLNIVVINTINNKEVGDAFYEYLKQTGATPLEQYTTVLTQSPYHRTQLVYDAETYTDGRVLNTYYLFTNKMNDIAIARLAGCMCAYMDLFGESTGNIATALIQGKQAQYDEFWDTYQNYGNRTFYQYAFAGRGAWKPKILKPKYDIKLTNAQGMFAFFQETGHRCPR